jgi:hypothetical protein
VFKLNQNAFNVKAVSIDTEMRSIPRRGTNTKNTQMKCLRSSAAELHFHFFSFTIMHEAMLEVAHWQPSTYQFVFDKLVCSDTGDSDCHQSIGETRAMGIIVRGLSVHHFVAPNGLAFAP